MFERIIKIGVAPSAILEEAGGTHTWDNARLSRLLLDQKGVAVKRGIICCKGFHARRSLQFYSFAFPEAEFYVQTVPYIENGILIGKDTWHQTEAGVNRVLGELKRLGTQFTPPVFGSTSTITGLFSRSNGSAGLFKSGGAYFYTSRQRLFGRLI